VWTRPGPQGAWSEDAASPAIWIATTANGFTVKLKPDQTIEYRLHGKSPWQQLDGTLVQVSVGNLGPDAPQKPEKPRDSVDLSLPPKPGDEVPQKRDILARLASSGLGMYREALESLGYDDATLMVMDEKDQAEMFESVAMKPGHRVLFKNSFQPHKANGIELRRLQQKEVVRDFVDSLSKLHKPSIYGFISYAWEPIVEKNKALQFQLQRLKRVLVSSGVVDVFLDVDRMEGDLNQAMRDNLARANFVILIGTPRLKERGEAAVPNNLQFELGEIAKRIATKAETGFKFLPILFEGSFRDSFPARSEIFDVDVFGTMIYDLREDHEHMIDRLVLTGLTGCDPLGELKCKGLLGVVHGLDDANAAYAGFVHALQLEFKEINKSLHV
jgi:hypothetical protein